MIMPIRTLVIVFAVCTYIIASFARQGENMSGQDSRITLFKKDISFDKITELGGPDSGVVAVWPAMDSAPQLSDKDWQIDSFSVSNHAEGAEGEWILKNGQQTIMLRIFVSSQGVESIRNHFLEVATSTMMMEIPYKKTEVPIGTLSVTIPRIADDYIWFFYNICFSLRGIDTDVNLEGLARWVQSFAEAGLVKDVKLYTQFIDHIGVEPKNIGVNDTFQASSILMKSTSASLKNYIFEFLYDDQKVELEVESENVARFRAIEAGNTEIKVKVINTKTFLANTQKVNVNIHP